MQAHESERRVPLTTPLYQILLLNRVELSGIKCGINVICGVTAKVVHNSFCS